jgi:undecaprenyl diphosphate synthase
MHVAIIMDGNGRWAERRGLGRTAGHRAGARSVRRVVEAAVRSDVDILTLYAFSADNWSRPPAEVQALMRLFKLHLRSEVARCVENGIRLNVIGRRDRLSAELVRTVEEAERLTAAGSRLTLQIAIDYSAREAILRAASLFASEALPSPEPRARRRASGRDGLQRFTESIARAMHSCVSRSCVDLLIRTGGERRLSDFLLWECAYAELVFVDACWPDFDDVAFNAALQEFRRRDRRFGGLSSAPNPQLARGAG